MARRPPRFRPCAPKPLLALEDRDFIALTDAGGIISFHLGSFGHVSRARIQQLSQSCDGDDEKTGRDTESLVHDHAMGGWWIGSAGDPTRRDPLGTRHRAIRSADHFEGIAIGSEGGHPTVWIVSDDNFASWQRTLLLEFTLD